MNIVSSYWLYIFQALVLLLAANGAPIIANKLLGQRWAKPIDGGWVFPDRRRLLGDTKTWRGLVAAMLFAACMALLFKLEVLVGLLFGALAMGGDLLASFLKRRRGHVESSRARALDTLPESLLPVWLLKAHLHLDWGGIGFIVGAFFLIEEFGSPVLYKWHIRNRPY